MVEVITLSLVSHCEGMADRVEVVSQLCRMANSQATLKEIYPRENQVKSMLKGKGEPVTIPVPWICGVYREQEGS